MKIIRAMACFVFLNECATTNSINQRHEIFDNYIVEHKLKPVDKIRSFQFRYWKSLDDSHLIISSSLKKQYLTTVNTYCQNLDFAHQIGLKQSTNNSLNAKIDSIVIKGDHNQECRIKTTHQINKDQEDELVKLRKNYFKKLKSEKNKWISHSTHQYLTSS